MEKVLKNNENDDLFSSNCLCPGRIISSILMGKTPSSYLRRQYFFSGAEFRFLQTNDLQHCRDVTAAVLSIRIVIHCSRCRLGFVWMMQINQCIVNIGSSLLSSTQNMTVKKESQFNSCSLKYDVT